MPQPANGSDQVLRNTRQTTASATTVEQLRQTQAVVLPLGYGGSQKYSFHFQINRVREGEAQTVRVVRQGEVDKV